MFDKLYSSIIDRSSIKILYHIDESIFIFNVKIKIIYICNKLFIYYYFIVIKLFIIYSIIIINFFVKKIIEEKLFIILKIACSYPNIFFKFSFLYYLNYLNRKLNYIITITYKRKFFSSWGWQFNYTLLSIIYQTSFSLLLSISLFKNETRLFFSYFQYSLHQQR